MARKRLHFTKFGDDNYPKREFEGQEDQSYGFNPAHKLQTGTFRGTFRIQNDDGSFITIGKVADLNEFGTAYYDANGRLLRKSTALNDIYYDPQDEYRARMLQGGSPVDGHMGTWKSQEGLDVVDLLEEE